MRKILFLNPDRGHTCSYYRSGGISTNLRKQLGNDYTIEVFAWQDLHTDWQTISEYDLVMMQRPYSATMLDFAKHVKQMNIKLWIDYDDNLFTVTPENRAWQVFNDPSIKGNVKQFISIADVVTVTTEDLKESYLPLNKNIIVIPNAFNDDIFDINRLIVERENTVLWRGSDTHIYDIMTCSLAIDKITAEFPEYEFKYMGYYPWFLKAAKNVAFEKARDIIDYFAVIYNMHPAVVHVPLYDCNFNRCKSNIAYIEGSFAGAVCIVPEWWRTFDNKVLPGTLQYKDDATYYEALRSVLAGEVDIKAMNEIAWQYVKQNLLLSSINKLRVQVIKDLFKSGFESITKRVKK
jgi:hypothetical protein